MNGNERFLDDEGCEINWGTRYKRPPAGITLSDEKIPVDVNNDFIADYYKADIVSAQDYYPFGMMQPGRNFNASTYRYSWNTQERLDELSGSGNHLTAPFWEYDTRTVHRWNLDPKPNTSFSPYAINQNNPIWYSDPYGDSVKIQHNKGFLGLGGKQTLNYEGGSLFNSDGSAYEGKVKGFLGKTVNALNEGSANSSEGAGILSELESSTNVFTIKKGSNGFSPSDNIGAFAGQHIDEAMKGSTNPISSLVAFGLISSSGGSGGTIGWNPNKGSLWEQGGGSAVRSTTNLFHEMAHGFDANRGLLDSRPHLGVTRSEWQAVYRENMMRSQMGLPLRTHYKSTLNLNTGVTSPSGPSMLTPSGKPIKPSW